MSFITAQTQPFYLSGSGAIIGATSVTLKSFRTIDGAQLTMTSIGDKGFMTLEPGNSTQEEQISFTTVTLNSNGTTTLGGVKNVSFLTPYTETSGLAKTHAGSSIAVLSNTSGFYGNIKDYVDTGLSAGAVPATTTTNGIGKISVAPVSAASPIFVGDNDTRLSGGVGVMTLYAGSSAPTGWLLCDGAAISRTTYATLFGIISTTYGIGDNSTTFNIPDMRGRIPVGVGTGTKVATFASRSSNVITVTGLTDAANNEFQTGQAVLYSAPSGAMTGLTHNTTYYLVRTGNLTFSLATSLANAQNGTVISLSSDGTGTQTFTLTLTARTGGDTGGEENHAMSSTELLAHTHTVNPAAGPAGIRLGNASADQSAVTSSSTGGNAAMNNMQPFVSLNYIIKY